MQKPKKYDWKDSNMALFGSDTEKKVKKESAECEPAWQGCGKEVSVKIWRIVKFEVKDWPEERYGEFYSGDSYIILNTYKDDDEDELKYDVHFWIGKYSTQDEYGTAAYKTVELDTFLDDKPIQHREVQGHESALFKSYFDTIKLLKGGAETGFHHVIPEAYRPRMVHVKKEGRKFRCVEVGMKRGNLKSDDVFIIDIGSTIYQFNGATCSHDEKYRAAQEIAKMKDNRNVEVENLEEGSLSSNHLLFNMFKDGESKSKISRKGERKLFEVSDEDGSLDMKEIAEGDIISKELLRSEQVYVLNTGMHCYCWIGKKASIEERKNGLAYATNYLHKTETPFLPLSVVTEGKENNAFKNAF